MNPLPQKNDQVKDVPFFSRFLEGQELPKVKTGVNAGPKYPPPEQTMKAPSDRDEI